MKTAQLMWQAFKRIDVGLNAFTQGTIKMGRTLFIILHIFICNILNIKWVLDFTNRAQM